MSQELRQVVENVLPATSINPKETLKQHEEGEVLTGGVDLFEIKGTNYLVTVDYYPNFIEIDYLSTKTTNQVITKLKGQFARYGIPVPMITDSGTQFLLRYFRNFKKRRDDTPCNVIITLASPVKRNGWGRGEDSQKDDV